MLVEPETWFDLVHIPTPSRLCPAAGRQIPLVLARCAPFCLNHRHGGAPLHLHMSPRSDLPPSDESDLCCASLGDETVGIFCRIQLGTALACIRKLPWPMLVEPDTWFDLELIPTPSRLRPAAGRQIPLVLARCAPFCLNPPSWRRAPSTCTCPTVGSASSR